MLLAAEILVFGSPFDDPTSLTRKITKIETAFSDYFLSSLWVDVRSENSGDTHTRQIHLPTLEIILITRWGTTFSYDPAISISIRIAHGRFDVALVGTLISDLTSVIRWVFQDDYFIDTANEFELSAYARGTPREASDLEGFDLARPQSSKNRKTLSYLLFTRYGLCKSLERMLALETENKIIDNAKAPAILPTSHAGSLDLASKRLSTLQSPLKQQIKQIESLITNFISLL